MSKEFYHCFSLKMAGYLIMRGCIPMHIQDSSQSRRKVFLFNDTEYLRKSIVQYKIIKDELNF